LGKIELARMQVELRSARKGHPELKGADRLAWKLYTACVQKINRELEFCLGIVESIAKGESFVLYEQMQPYELEKYYQTHGFVIYDKTSNTTLLPLDMVFTDPDSEQYAVQSLYKEQFVPKLNHNNPRYDILKILKFRLDNDTVGTNVPFPRFFSPRDIADRLAKHIGMTPKHPLNTVYSMIANLTQKTTEPLDFTVAGAEVFNARLTNITSPYNFSSYIISGLQDIPDVYIHIATEPVRLALANRLFDISPIEKLWTVGRTSMCEAEFLVNILTLKRRCNYQIVSFRYPTSFNSLNKNDINTLRLLIESAHMTSSQALALFNDCPPPSASYAEMGKGLELIVNVKAMKNYINSTMEFVPEGVLARMHHDYVPLPTRYAAWEFIYKNLDPIHINISCDSTMVKLGEKTFALGLLNRSPVRKTKEARYRDFIAEILMKKFIGTTHAHLYQDIHDGNAGNGINHQLMDLHLLNFLEHTSNINDRINLIFDDACSEISPFSPFYDPEHNDFSVGFPHDLSSIHTRIMDICTYQNAQTILGDFIKYSVLYIGGSDEMKICQQYARAEVTEGWMHRLVSKNLPADYHERSHRLEEFSSFPILFFPMLATSMALMLLFYLCMRPRYSGPVKRYVGSFFNSKTEPSPRSAAVEENIPLVYTHRKQKLIFFRGMPINPKHRSQESSRPSPTNKHAALAV
jgi:hypothetical protein